MKGTNISEEQGGRIHEGVTPMPWGGVTYAKNRSVTYAIKEKSVTYAFRREV